MSHTIELPIAELKAVALFAGKKDIRSSFNGVLITSDQGKAVAVATDGHRLTAFKSEADYSGPEFIVPIDNVTALKATQRIRCVEVTYDAETRMVKLVTGETAQICQAIDAQYPDWRRVIPALNQCSGKPTDDCGFNAAYLGDYAKLRKLIGAGFTSITIKPNESRAARISVSDSRFVCVLMPTHDLFTPSWFDEQETTAKEKVAA